MLNFKKNIIKSAILSSIMGASLLSTTALAGDFDKAIEKNALKVEKQVIKWRHHFHQNPELSNREFKTSKAIAAELKKLGFEVQTGVAGTGIVGILKGNKKGPVVALRADIDGLPVLEDTGLSFASKAKGTYLGKEVPVMHACGHDAHIAILLGVAKVLNNMKDDIYGTVKFIFQPAEEGVPLGEVGGAKQMVKEGVLKGKYAPEAIFALHVGTEESGVISYRSKGTMAAADGLYITVKGRQTHGSSPWNGVDPIIASAQIMTALQLIPSRRLNITTAPSVITIGSIHGGVRGNIIPDEVKLMGTIRTFDTKVRAKLLETLRITVKNVAEANGATAEVIIDPYAPVTYNDPILTKMMLPSIINVVGNDKLKESDLIMGAEDFSYYQEQIPGLYVFLGARPDDKTTKTVDYNHSPKFIVNDKALKVGVRTLSTLALDYLHQKSTAE